MRVLDALAAPRRRFDAVAVSSLQPLVQPYQGTATHVQDSCLDQLIGLERHHCRQHGAAVRLSLLLKLHAELDVVDPGKEQGPQ